MFNWLRRLFRRRRKPIPWTPYKFVWTGDIDRDWNNPGNWDIGIVPGDAAEIVIPEGSFIDAAELHGASSMIVLDGPGRKSTFDSITLYDSSCVTIE